MSTTRELSPSLALITKGTQSWRVDHAWALWKDDELVAIFPNPRSAMGFVRAMVGYTLPWGGDQDDNALSRSSTILEAVDPHTSSRWVMQQAPFMPWAKEVDA